MFRFWSFLASLALASPAEQPEAAESAALLQLGLALGDNRLQASDENLTQNFTNPLAGCWDHFPPRDPREIFLLHIGKVGGCSLVADLSKFVNRSDIWSSQVCYSASQLGTFEKTIVMLRRPKDLVLSMYHQCDWPGEAEFHKMEKMGVAPGQPGHILPDFPTWVREWATNPPTDYYVASPMWDDRFHCNNPRNMMSKFLTCTEPTGNQPSYDANEAIEVMEEASIMGILEVYHESICVFVAELRDYLPSHCNCEDEAAWNSFQETHITHNHTYNETVDDYNQSIQQYVEEITRTDKLLYEAGVRRFLREVRKVERRYGTKVLCDEPRTKLLESIAEI